MTDGRWKNEDGKMRMEKMRMEKYGWINADGKMRMEILGDKIRWKENQERKLIYNHDASKLY